MIAYPTPGHIGPGMDGPFCYVSEWDIEHHRQVSRLLDLPTKTQRQHALKQIEALAGKAARVRMENSLIRLDKWRKQDAYHNAQR